MCWQQLLSENKGVLDFDCPTLCISYHLSLSGFPAVKTALSSLFPLPITTQPFAQPQSSVLKVSSQLPPLL